MGLSEIFKRRDIFVNMLIMAVIWAFTAFNFYLMSFQLKYLSGDLFSNTITSSLAQSGACLFGGVLYQKVGIKWTLGISFFLSMLGSLLLMLNVTESRWLISCFILIARFGCSSTFNIVYIANSDIFPPIFSATIFGICNTGSRILTISAPIIAEMGEPYPMMIHTIFGLIGSILPVFLQIDKQKVKQN